MQTKASDSLDTRIERRSKPTCAVIFLSFLAFLLALIDTRLTVIRSAFFHKRSFSGHDEPYVGQAVSFVYGEGLKGAVATKVKVEEGGSAIQEAPVEDEGDREMGAVKVCVTPT